MNEPKAVVVTTQFKENYGAHDWDGKGQCPQYWKFKGGSEYWMVSLLPNASPEAMADLMDKLDGMVTHKSNYTEEYALATTFMPVKQAQHLVALNETDWVNGDEHPILVYRPLK